MAIIRRARTPRSSKKLRCDETGNWETSNPRSQPTITGLWLGCLLDLPGGDPLTCTILFALLIVIVMRHRIRAAILAVR
jgi:hypothetical protein